MHLLVTNASGFVGSAITQDLRSAGHQVIGSARSDAAAGSLIAAGVEVHRGELERPETRREGAAAADMVVHTAFIHDLSKFKEVCEVERLAVAALGAALAGSNKPVLITSGMAFASNRQTREAVGWSPVQPPLILVQPSLVADFEHGSYFKP